MARNYRAEYEARKARYPTDVAARRGHLSPIAALGDQVAHSDYLDRNWHKVADLKDSDQALAANARGMAAAKAAGKVPVDYLRERPRQGEHRHTKSFPTRQDAEREANRAPGYAYLVRTGQTSWKVIYQPESATARLRRRRKNRRAG
jgi:hypothetical protein